MKNLRWFTLKKPKRSLNPLCWLALITLCISISAKASTLHSVGVARDGDDKIRYIEHHQYLATGEHLVDYYDPSMRLILEKALTYAGLPQQPSLRQLDPVNNVEITISRDEDQGRMIKQTADGEKSFVFDLSEEVIIDAGFDSFVRNQWETFATQKEQDVKLAVAGQLRLIDMQISYVGETDGMREFTITPKNWLIGLLIPETRLTYTANRRLLRYRGLSNLRLNPRPGVVDINFEHLNHDPLLSGIVNEQMAAKISLTH